CSHNSPSGASGGRSSSSAWFWLAAPGAALLSRGGTNRGSEPVWPGSCGPPLDHLERLALRGICLDHHLWADGQRLPISQTGAAHSRWLDSWRDRDRLFVWPQSPGLVPLSLSGEWRLRFARQTCAD